MNIRMHPGYGSAGRVLLLAVIVLSAPSVLAAESPAAPPSLSIQFGSGRAEDLSIGIQILILLTALSLAPSLMIMLTSFARIVVVLSFLRQALGTQQAPPNQVLVSIALFVTLFVMSPVWQQVNAEALQPYLDQQITQPEALDRGIAPIRSFMLRQVRERDLALFLDLSDTPAPKDLDGIPTHVVIPAFMISELKTAFQIGFLIYIPFLIIDMVVASVLMSMGMMMLPPIMVSLPFKLILFVLADGWYLVVSSLVRSFV